MSNENNNNDDDEQKTKTTLFPKDKESTQNNNNIISPEKNKKKYQRRFSNLDNLRLSIQIADPNEMKNIERMKKDLKRGLTRRVVNNKKKKGKKGKKKEKEKVLLTEVKPPETPKKEEKKESVTHKFLREKLEKLNFSKNLQLGINFGFEKINSDIKDNLVDNIIIKDKKLNLDSIINNKRKSPELNLGKNGITYTLNKESILRLKHLKANEKNIRYKLNKLEESEKLIESEEPIKNDLVAVNLRNNNLKKYNSMKNELLSKLSYNNSIISEVIEKDKVINKNLLIRNYNNNSNKSQIDSFSKHFSLSEDQEKFNKYLIKKQQEEKIKREKIENELKRSNSKKTKEIELNEKKILERQKEHLIELKKKEKEFFNKLKEKNNLLFEKSIKNIDKNQKKQAKDYLFYQVRQRFENNEKKLVDKVNMIKKDSLVTKQELEELQNRRNERRKILEEGLTERKLNLIKMWKNRSENIPKYKHPLVDVLENEKLDIMEDEQEKQEQKENNKKNKLEYQPPKVKVDLQLKQIREKRILMSHKDSVTTTEANNKKRFMKNLEFMANIIEAAKEENLEKNKNKKTRNIKTEKEKDATEKIKLAKSLDTSEIKKRFNYQLHPKPEKPIDYLKEMMKGKKMNQKKEKKDQGVGEMLAELKDDSKINGRNQIIDAVDMIKSKTDAIDQKVTEKKEFMKVKGGYIKNTNIGDEVGDLLIESIQTKLSLLNKLKGK